MELIPAKIYSDEKMQRLYDGTLRILRDIGCWIDHDGLRDSFEKRGMRIDHSAKRVYFTKDLIDEILNPAAGKGDNINLRQSFPAKFDVEGSFPSYFDWTSKQSRPGDTKTLLEITRTFSNMPGLDRVGRVLTLSDVPQRIEPIISTALIIKHSPRPVLGEVYFSDNIPYLIEMGEILTGQAGSTDFIAPWICIVPPLKITHDEGDLITAKAKAGVTSIPTPMPSSGATAPVTREGTIAVELAEVIAVWLCSRIVNPEVPLNALFASSSFDMKTAQCIFSSPEAVFQDSAASQICRHFFGINSDVCTNYVDAKVPGIQATYEKLFKSFWAYQYQGYTLFKPGLLQAGQAFCPAQALLDVELWNSANALFKDAPKIEDEIPFDDIYAVTHTASTFLDSEHTLKLFRDTGFKPEFLDRTARGADEEEMSKAQGLLDRCQAKYNQACKEAPEYRADDDICQAIDNVVERARKSLLK